MGPISEHTNARAHCSFQLGATTEYGSTWLSVASSTYETCTVVQTLDFYPYGATRVSSSVGGADSARKFIGQFSDQSNLSYLNARYYNGTQVSLFLKILYSLAIHDSKTHGIHS